MAYGIMNKNRLSNLSILISFLIFIATNQLHCKEVLKKNVIKNSSQIRKVLVTTKQSDLSRMLTKFVRTSRPNRFVGSSGHQKAFDYINEHLRKYTDSNRGESITVDEFLPDIDGAIAMYQGDFDSKIKGLYPKSDPVYEKWSSFTNKIKKVLSGLRKIKGRNLIWEKRGTIDPDSLLIIGAHYDTIAFNDQSGSILTTGSMPGADNNGSGVVLALNLIKQLSTISIKKSVRVVFFDYQEIGFLGSHDFVNKLMAKKGSSLKIEGFINFLMLGHDTSTLDTEKKHGNMKAYIRRDNQAPDKAFAQSIIKRGRLVGPGVKFKLLANGFDLGANISFVKHKIPAVTFSQNWESDYNLSGNHSKKDFSESVNYKTYYNSYLNLCGGIISWLLDL